MEAPIINKVAKSPILNIDLKDWEIKGERIIYDLAQHLFQGLILKEADFRKSISDTDWSIYQGKHVAIHCSADAIVPTWAYMVIASELSPFAATVAFGSHKELEQKIWDSTFANIDWSAYDKKVVIVKGCSDIPVPEYAFVSLSDHLAKHARKLMFGEPCSTVPVYKK